MSHTPSAPIGYIQKEGEDTFAVYIGGHIADDLIRNFDRKVKTQHQYIHPLVTYSIDIAGRREERVCLAARENQVDEQRQGRVARVRVCAIDLKDGYCSREGVT